MNKKYLIGICVIFIVLFEFQATITVNLTCKIAKIQFLQAKKSIFPIFPEKPSLQKIINQYFAGHN